MDLKKRFCALQCFPSLMGKGTAASASTLLAALLSHQVSCLVSLLTNLAKDKRLFPESFLKTAVGFSSLVVIVRMCMFSAAASSHHTLCHFQSVSSHQFVSQLKFAVRTLRTLNN
jgi:hypothetical protein